MTRFFEDLAVGQKYGSGRVRVSAAEIKEFAASLAESPQKAYKSALSSTCRH